MSPQDLILLIVFVMAASGVMLVYLLINGRKAKLDERLRDLSGRSPGVVKVVSRVTTPVPESITLAKFARQALPRMGSTLVPTDDTERTLLRSRLVYAGYYSPQALPIFLGVKLVLMLAPAIVGVVAGSMSLVPLRLGVLVGACTGIIGMIGPSLFLDKVKAKRQSIFRQGLPDALDLLVICLEGGLSLQGALKRISTELKTAHPKLALELTIVQREIQLGRSPGEALQEMAKRTDLEEIRGLSSVITQSERFGASLVKALRVHSDVLRQKRHQQAEEMGQKASTKVLFPTLLFIFPAIFVVILGPAAIHVSRTFLAMK